MLLPRHRRPPRRPQLSAQRPIRTPPTRHRNRPPPSRCDDRLSLRRSNRIEGIVTNWGNPLQGFNDHMKTHTDTQFYTSAFFIVMNKDRYDGLPPDIRAAVDAISGEALVAQFGPLWDKWDKPVREGATGPGHEIIVPDAKQMEEWRAVLKPVTDCYLDELSSRGVPNARAAYDKLVAALRR